MIDKFHCIFMIYVNEIHYQSALTQLPKLKLTLLHLARVTDLSR